MASWRHSGSLLFGLAACLVAYACRTPSAPVGYTPRSELVSEPLAASRPADAGPPQAGPGSLVLFSVQWDGVMPVACYDGNLKRIQAGVDCLGLVAEGDQVATDHDQQFVLGRRKDVACPRGHTQQPGMALVNDPPAEFVRGTRFAVWPAAARSELWLSAADLKPTAAELGEVDALLGQILVQESTDNLPANQRAFQVYTGDAVDLDGDGVLDRVFSGVVDALEGFRFTGLVGFLSSRERKVSIIHRDPAHVYYLQGSVNLDGSGGRELLLTRALVQHASGAAIQVEDAVAVLERNEYRIYGLPCQLLGAHD